MRAMLIWLNDRITWEEVPETLRYGHYQKAKQLPVNAKIIKAAEPLHHEVVTFSWRGQLVRKSGHVILDYFEEVE